MVAGETLTDEDKAFLSSLPRDGSRAVPLRLPLATRAQDHARTRAKRFGWAGFNRKDWGWTITERGLSALDAAGPAKEAPSRTNDQ